MGYTHYWEGPRVITPEAVEDINKIIAQSGVSIRGRAGEGDPEVSESRIRLNGDEARVEEYETFDLTLDPEFSFCKTARQPYDAVVCAALIRVREDSPDFVISSDGLWDDPDEWGVARALFTQATGREPVAPIQ